MTARLADLGWLLLGIVLTISAAAFVYGSVYWALERFIK